MTAISAFDAQLAIEAQDKLPLMLNSNKTASVELGISGMTCQGCAAAVKSALLSGPGVNNIKVDFAGDSATISYDTSVTCEEDLMDRIEHAGFSVRNEESMGCTSGPLLIRMIIALAFAIPEFIVCMFMHGNRWLEQRILGFLTMGMSIEFALASGAMLWVGRRVLGKASKSIAVGAPGMDVLIGIGISVSYLASVWFILLAALNIQSQHHEMVFFETVTSLLATVCVGKFLEGRAKDKCWDQVREIASSTPTLATRVVGGATETVGIKQLAKGDHILIRENERIPVDGVCVSGGAVDESIVTGESLPQAKSPGDQLFAGSLWLLSTPGLLVATHVGSGTLLAQIGRSIRNGKAEKPYIQGIADRLASFFVPFILSIGLVTFASWSIIGILQSNGLSETLVTASKYAITVITVACPCALGLATPMAVVVGRGAAARRGIIIINSGCIDRAGKKVDRILFDKTGTLTVGRAEVVSFTLLGSSVDRNQILDCCVKMEEGSQHVLGRAIEEYCRAQLTCNEESKVSNVQSIVGGLSAHWNNVEVLIGSEETLAIRGIKVTTNVDSETHHGRSIVHVAVAGYAVGYFTIGDAIRADAKEALSALQSKCSLGIVSGDNWTTTLAVADSLGIPNVHAGKTPFDKAAIVTRHQMMGETVVFVGDGINDAPALARSDTSITLLNSQAAADLSVAAADIVLLRPSIQGVSDALSIVALIRRCIIWNFLWALVYNVFAIPIAAGCLSPLGVHITPAQSGVFMAASSLSVILSSLSLRSKIAQI